MASQPWRLPRSYNLRVVECRMAAALVARKLGAAPEAAAAVRTLREVEPATAAAHGAGMAGQVHGRARVRAYV
jgi:N-acetylgalactosamine kinase